MTIEELIAQIRAAMSAKLEARATHVTVLSTVRAALTEGKDPSDEQSDQMRAAADAIAGIDAEVDQLKARIKDLEQEKQRDEAATRLQRELVPAGGGQERGGYDKQGRVLSEPRTYSRQSNRDTSFFQDAWAWFNRSSPDAEARIQRHASEVKAEREMTQRATSTSSFAGLVIPQYLVDQAALLARAGRPFANTCQKLPLPEQGTTFQIPRGTTGASAAVQATENSSVSSTDEAWANVTLNVATIAGQQDISRQSLDRGTPGIDELIFTDLSGAYFVALDQQVLSGSGSSGQVLGVQNTAGVNQATAFAAAATGQTFYSKTAGQVNAVETTRFLAPTATAMHPRRWNWLTSQVDSQGRPLVVPNQNGPMNAMASFDKPVDTPAVGPVGMFLGLPVITDASIPFSVGSGPEDLVFVYRAQDLLLFEEGDGTPTQLRFEQTLGNQLTWKMVVYGYIAFTAGRYPAAVGIVGGNSAAGFGLVAPTF